LHPLAFFIIARALLQMSEIVLQAPASAAAAIDAAACGVVLVVGCDVSCFLSLFSYLCGT
jgi:hypothetical protein